jgi:glutathione synthase
MSSLNILFLTDSRSHNHDDTIFPLARNLRAMHHESEISICDRANSINAGFFDAPLLAEELDVYTLSPSENYNVETAAFYLKDNALCAPKHMMHFDVIIMALDQPVSERFLKALPFAFPDAYFVNDPVNALELGNKGFLAELVSHVPDIAPYTVAMEKCSHVHMVENFASRHGYDIVLKPMEGYGGDGVKRYGIARDADLICRSDVKGFLEQYGDCLAMPRLRNEQQSDNRLVVIDGELVGAIQRRPKAGAFLCNMAAGATAHVVEPSKQEYAMIERLKPLLREKGLMMVGIDTLLDCDGNRVLSEINTLNAGGLSILEELTGMDYTKVFAHYIIEASLAVQGAQGTQREQRRLKMPALPMRQSFSAFARRAS